jgi:competence protein ComEC
VIRAAPDSASAPLDALDPGEQLTLVREVPSWFEVRLPDGRIGYVSKSWTVVVGEPDEAAELENSLKVHVIDVGTGLATFIEGPGFTMLFDAGSQDDLADGADNRVVAYIKRARPGLKVLDHVILSHPHKDHLELLPDVFDEFSVRHVWDSGAVNKTRGYCRFLRKVAEEPGAQYHNAVATGGYHQVTFPTTSCAGTVRVARAAHMTSSPVALGSSGARMSILHRDAAPHHDPNENSLVVRLDFAGKRILMMGDAEAGARAAPSATPEAESVEAELLRCCRPDLRADVLIVGHHGSLTSSRRAFLDAVGASEFVISSGPYGYGKNKVVLPDREVVAELSGRGRVFRTDLEDELCLIDSAKVGPDSDESPGGCANVKVLVSSTGTLTAKYHPVDD